MYGYVAFTFFLKTIQQKTFYFHVKVTHCYDISHQCLREPQISLLFASCSIFMFRVVQQLHYLLATFVQKFLVLHKCIKKSNVYFLYLFISFLSPQFSTNFSFHHNFLSNETDSQHFIDIHISLFKHAQSPFFRSTSNYTIVYCFINTRNTEG